LLFATLTRECRVFPFLYAYDEHRLLMGSLGRGSSGTAPGPPDPIPRRPVMATLQQALQGIEIFEEAGDSLELVTDHRYDRVAPGAGPPTSPGPT
jgi:hypothetical protein